MRKGKELWASEESQSNNQQTIIGPFVFKNPVPRVLKQLLKRLYINFRSNAQSLRIQNGRMQQLMPQEALQIAECYRIQELQEFSLANNSFSNTSILQKCQFQNLLILNLSRNRLASFADLAQNIHFPLLEELILCSNQFTTMRGIKRWRMNMLSKLTLQLNYIVDVREMSQATLPALCHLQIYSNNIADFRPIFRVDFPKLQTLEIYSNSYNSDHCTAHHVLQRKFRYLLVGSLRI